MPSAATCDARVLAQPSLPKARQWLVWLRYHYAELPAHPGWARGLRDTLLGLHYTVAIAARRLRKNPTWDFQGTMIDDTSLRGGGTRGPELRMINQKHVPTSSGRSSRAVRGLRQQTRLAREIDAMRRQGRACDVYVLKSGTFGRAVTTEFEPKTPN